MDFILEELKSTLKLWMGERLDIIQKKIEKVRNNKYWFVVLELSRIFLFFNIYLYAYTKDNYTYEIYFKFEVDKPNEEFKLLYIHSKHYNILYKRNNLENSTNNILTNESIDNIKNIKKEISR